MDINKAIRFVLDDAQWIKKVLIGALLTVFSFLIVPALMLSGYLIKIIRQVMNGEWDGLPEWDDYGEFLKDGFFVTVAQLIYTLPFILLMLIGGLATGGFAAMAGSEDAAGLIAGGGFLLMFCLILIVAIAFLFLTPAIMIQYAIKDDLAACFRFGEIMDIIRNNLADILIVFLVTVAAGVALSIVTGIASATLILIPVAILLSVAFGPFISYVTAHLYGQIAAKVLGNKAGGPVTFG